MARKLSRRSQQRVARNLALIESINVLVNSIPEEQLTDLIRRDAIGIGHDGYPEDSMPEYSGGGSGGSRTETAALHGLPGVKGGADNWGKAAKKKRGHDVVRKQLAQIENNLNTANKALREAVYTITHLDKQVEEARGRQTSTPCEICGLYAAQKSGWCAKDYDEWESDGRPDRVKYAMWRRQDKNSEGLLLVPEKPAGKLKT